MGLNIDGGAFFVYVLAAFLALGLAFVFLVMAAAVVAIRPFLILFGLLLLLNCPVFCGCVILAFFLLGACAHLGVGTKIRSMAESRRARCVESVDDDPATARPSVTDCAACGEPVCDWHGKQYRNGYQHETCHEIPDYNSIARD